MLFVRKGLLESRPTLQRVVVVGGNIAGIRHKRQSVPHILARIVDPSRIITVQAVRTQGKGVALERWKDVNHNYPIPQ